MDQAGVIVLTKKQYLMKIILEVGKAAWCKERKSSMSAQKLILQSVWQRDKIESSL